MVGRYGGNIGKKQRGSRVNFRPLYGLPMGGRDKREPADERPTGNRLAGYSP